MVMVTFFFVFNGPVYPLKIKGVVNNWQKEKTKNDFSQMNEKSKLRMESYYERKKG